MHSLLIQLLIAYLDDKEFSPEEYKQLLDEADKELGYAGMIPFYDIHNQVSKERIALREKFNHPTPKFMQRQIVKQVVGKEAAQANEPRLPVKQHPEVSSSVDWQPRYIKTTIL